MCSGVRCEKAAIYLKHRAPNTEIYQLQGGIHKYLDTFPDGGHWKGKNFVFDGRLAMSASNVNEHSDNAVIGKCIHCAIKYDSLSDSVQCTVCKSFVILCNKCTQLYQINKWNIFCAEHILLTAAEGAVEEEHPHFKFKLKGENHKRQKIELPRNSISDATDGSYESAAAASNVTNSVAVRPISSSSTIPPSIPSMPAVSSMNDPADIDCDETVTDIPSTNTYGCIEQFHSFLSRFSIMELEHQLSEIDGLLNYFHSIKKKSASSGRNRKANLHIQRRRLQAYITQRKLLPQSNERNNSDVSVCRDENKSDINQAPIASASSSTHPPLLPFVPFLNV
jgi:hypothetical protein